jgi:hypothetical protein
MSQQLTAALGREAVVINGFGALAICLLCAVAICGIAALFQFTRSWRG